MPSFLQSVSVELTKQDVIYLWLIIFDLFLFYKFSHWPFQPKYTLGIPISWSKDFHSLTMCYTEKYFLMLVLRLSHHNFIWCSLDLVVCEWIILFHSSFPYCFRCSRYNQKKIHEEKNVKGKVQERPNEVVHEFICFAQSFTFRLVRKELAPDGDWRLDVFVLVSVGTCPLVD